MEFFKNLFGENRKPNHEPASDKADLLKMIEPAPGCFIPNALAKYWDEIRKTRREAAIIKPTPNDNLTLRQSKFGHYPCMPKNFDYPLDRYGDYMYPLAQINFSEVPKLNGFPESGYLQFYIHAGEVYGLSFEDNIPSDFKVLFFEESDVTEIKEDFSFLTEVVTGKTYTPVFCPHSLEFTFTHEYVGISEFPSSDVGAFNIDRVLEENKIIAKELEEIIYNTFQTTGSKVGGYAYFTQADPRNYNIAIEDYILLFQMDSGNQIMWGDMGVGNFFIHPEQLQKKDFSGVYYTWDCA